MSYDSNNIFAKILREEIPCDKVFEDDFVLAFRDIAPAAPKHILVIPKAEVTSFDDFVKREEECPGCVSGFFQRVQQIAEQEGLIESGYRLITNHGVDANQTVPHFHVHILGDRNLGGLVDDDSLNR